LGTLKVELFYMEKSDGTVEDPTNPSPRTDDWETVAEKAIKGKALEMQARQVTVPSQPSQYTNYP